MEIKSFKEFFANSNKHLVLVFEDFSIPTENDNVIFEKTLSIAKSEKAQYRIYTSTGQNSNKNPLHYSEKIKIMRKMFPKHSRNIIEDKSIGNVSEALNKIEKEGFNKITIITDKNKDLNESHLLNTDINIISIKNNSNTSEIRNSLVNNDFKTFKLGLPTDFKDDRKMFNLIRTRLGITEAVKVDLKSSDIREKYFNKEIFNVGDVVKNLNGDVLTISERKTNFIVAEDGNKYFINDLKI